MISKVGSIAVIYFLLVSDRVSIGHRVKPDKIDEYKKAAYVQWILVIYLFSQSR